jgi:hypothetical protein
MQRRSVPTIGVHERKVTMMSSIGRARTIDDVLAIERAIDAALPPADGVACFNKLYMTVTASLIAKEQSGFFTDTKFITGLDVYFGNLYFEAYDASATGTAPSSWAPLFAARSRTDIAPLQFALAGMNAHINHDLPLALVQTFTAMQIEMTRPSPPAMDYDKVNDVLAAVEAEIRDEYFTPLMQQTNREFDGVDDIAANWSVRAARAAAWTNGEALWHLRAYPTLAKDYLAALDGIVGFAGRGLLVPTGP